MKIFMRWICALALFCLACALLGAGVAEEAGLTDYAGMVKLNLSSETVKQEVSVKTFVDGDTTHFLVPTSVLPSGVLKARYLAINTPEITGKVEEYGKKAAAFTREKLLGAVSILIESDDTRWNLDSTGERHLVWVWYKPSATEEYRNLNIEILQNGLALGNSAANNRYSTICSAALAQARAQKLFVYSGQRDPDFYYGDAIELTLKELRRNPEAYNGKKVAFTGVVTMNDNNSVFMEAFDAETGLYYGMTVYYGYGLGGAGLDVLMVGNESRIVGTLQYYEAGGTYQVSGLTYRLMKPKDPGNIQKISDGHSPAYVLTSADTFVGTVDLASEDGVKSYPYAALAMSTSIEMKDLTVLSAQTGDNGAMTLACEANGVAVTVRTVPLYDEQGTPITQNALLGKIIDVRGIVDFFDGAYQIKVFTSHGIAVRP